LTRNDYYGHGRINVNAALSATTADTTAPTFNSASVANHRAVDVLFNEPMGDGAETPSNYTLTAGQNTLPAASPNKVIRLTPNIYRLVWASGDIATSGTVTVQAASGIKDVAGNSLGANTSRSSTGTKRIVGVQCGGIPNDGPGYLYFGPYHMDSLEFEGNEYTGKRVTSTSHTSSYTYNSIDMSGVTDPAPENVYRSFRRSGAGSTLTYVIPNISAGNKNIRLHFSENNYSAVGAQKFDVKVNGVTKLSGVDIYNLAYSTQFRALTMTISSVAPDVNGQYTIDFVPVSSTYWTASVNAIEVLNP
jgi:hypothetical protein